MAGSNPPISGVPGDAGSPSPLPVVIVGAGPVGAVAALALAARGVRAQLFDAREPAAGKPDRRAIALSWGTRLALERLDVWGRIAHADPITRVSVSERGAFGSIEFDTSDLGTPALGFVVDYGDLARACAGALESAGIPTGWRTTVAGIEPGSESLSIALSPEGGIDGLIRTRCVVLADGAEGIDGGTAPARSARGYRQVALVGDVASERFTPGRAYERFAGSGPLALLPRAGHHACVWVVEPEVARRLLDSGPGPLARALEAAAGPAFGAMRWLTSPVQVPLSLRRAGRPPDPRIVPIGNAAQMLHPVAGQGFNLGVRDALGLASAWPPGADGRMQEESLLKALAGFTRARSADRAFTVAATDVIARVTAIDNPLMAGLRGLGLSAIDIVPGLRRRALEAMVFGAA
jgi:2-octaprenyl-6-methoxyphenol hydroxylase